MGAITSPAAEIRFLEWGCGFGGVTGAASLFGMRAVGIEALDFLCHQASALWRRHAISATVVHGNFLPQGADQLLLADDPGLAVQAAADEDAYAGMGGRLDEFDLIFAYPWPGEEGFLARVFEKFARPGAHLLLYRGPYHLELYRKSQVAFSA